MISMQALKRATQTQTPWFVGANECKPIELYYIYTPSVFYICVYINKSQSLPLWRANLTCEKKLSIIYISEISKWELYINKKVGQAIVRNAKSAKPADIAYTLKNFKLNITGSLGFNYAQVTRGGIKTNQITQTFESKLVQNLYLTGEMLNVDGDCGGYNLTFAFISGIISAKDLKKKLQVGE